MSEIYDYRELDLQSLDTILCAGNSRMSKAIYKMQKFAGATEEEARITHIAGVDKLRGISDLYVQESTTFNKWAGKSGVQINPFDEWLENYNGSVYVKKYDFTRTNEFQEKDFDFWWKHRNDPYESGIAGGFELFLCALRLHRFFPNYTPMATKELHCSEKYAMRVDAHGLWEEKVYPNKMPPFIWLNQTDELLRCNVSELIQIK